MIWKPTTCSNLCVYIISIQIQPKYRNFASAFAFIILSHKVLFIMSCQKLNKKILKENIWPKFFTVTFFSRPHKYKNRELANR